MHGSSPHTALTLEQRICTWIIFVAAFVFNVEGEFALGSSAHLGPWFVCAMPPIVIEVYSYLAIKRRVLWHILTALTLSVGLNVLDRAVALHAVQMTFGLTTIIVAIPSLAGALSMLLMASPAPAPDPVTEPVPSARTPAVTAPAERPEPSARTPRRAPEVPALRSVPGDDQQSLGRGNGPARAEAVRVRTEAVEWVRAAMLADQPPTWQAVKTRYGKSRKWAFEVLRLAKEPQEQLVAQ